VFGLKNYSEHVRKPVGSLLLKFKAIAKNTKVTCFDKVIIMVRLKSKTKLD
jgi:hypothetical protein